MANLSVTAANVSPGTNAETETALALEAITAGQVVYKSAAGRFGLCDNDNASAIIRKPYGIAVDNAAISQSVVVQKSGRINIGGTVVVGTPYWSSSTPGAISNISTDATTGKYPAFLGFAVATTTIDLHIKEAGVVVP